MSGRQLLMWSTRAFLALAAASLNILLLDTAAFAGIPAAGSQVAADSGRVAVTVTVLEGTVRLSGANVELRSLDGNVVLAKTVSDGSGQVVFPAVPPGRYAIQTERSGFFAASSAPFTVSAG